MYRLLDTREEESLLHFRFSTEFDEECIHIAPLYPTKAWVAHLTHIAENQNSQFKASNVVQIIAKLADEQHIVFSAVDWLGLALQSIRLYHAALNELAVQSTTETQRKCEYYSILAAALCDLSERFSKAVYATVNDLPINE